MSSSVDDRRRVVSRHDESAGHLLYYNCPPLAGVFGFIGFAALLFPRFIFSLYQSLERAAKEQQVHILLKTAVAVALIAVIFVLLHA